MEIRQLRHFLAILEQGSVSRAATAMGLSHQALSKSLGALESELKVKLFERGPRGMHPSPFGAALAKHAALINTETRHAALEIEVLKGGHSGTVNIGAGMSSVSDIVPRTINQLLKRHQGLSVRVLTGTFDELKKPLINGDIDLFVGTVLDQELEPNLLKTALFTDEDCVVARAEHPLVGKRKVRLKDLNEYKWIFSAGALLSRQALLNLFQESDLDPPQVAVESDSLEVTRATLATSDFLTLLPRSAFALHERAKLLSVVNFREGRWQRSVSICTRRRGSFAPATRLFMEELRKAAP